MKTMMVSDYLSIRGTLLQFCGLIIVVAVFMSIAIENVAASAATLTATIPFMIIFTLSAFDEKDGWDRFRLTLPITRKQVVSGRYAFVGLVTIAAMLFAFVIAYALSMILPLLSLGDGLDNAAGYNVASIIGGIVGAVSIMILPVSIALPLTMRYGITKATRIIPTIFVLAICAIAIISGNSTTDISFLQPAMKWLDTGNNYLFLAAAALVFDFAIYIISAFIAIKLYKKRTF